MAAPLLAAAKDLEWLSQLLTVMDEFVGGSGVEFKHVEVTWDREFRINVPC